MIKIANLEYASTLAKDLKRVHELREEFQRTDRNVLRYRATAIHELPEDYQLKIVAIVREGLETRSNMIRSELMELGVNPFYDGGVVAADKDQTIGQRAVRFDIGPIGSVNLKNL